MTNPKAKTTSKVKQKTKKEKPDVLNIPSQINLSFGDFKIKRLAAFDLLELVGNYVEPLSVLVSEDKLAFFKNVATSADFKHSVCKIFALFCDEEDHEQFEKSDITDLTKLVNGIKSVFSFEDIENLFLAFGLQEFLTTLTSTREEKSQSS